jgi:ATP-dependent helicase YprA (DUF1998 family)
MRLKAEQDQKYSSSDVRKSMADECLKRTGYNPYDWQLDISEAILLGLDSVLIAGTGAGKTLPFVLPLLADRTGYSKIIIISTLNELEKDQVGFMNALNIDNLCAISAYIH